MIKKLPLLLTGVVACSALAGPASGFVLSFSYDSRLPENDFTTSNNYNSLRDFAFEIDVVGGLAAGRTYSNPQLNGVVYNVFGILTSPTPSTFPAFNLQRTIGGAEFYAQGSSLTFETLATANMQDGLQVSELASFVFNGRELDTGRFHPSLVVLDNDGTGNISNSNNFSTAPPAPRDVDVDFGEEYDVDLFFDATNLTVGVPEPGSVSALAAAAVAFLFRRRRSA